MLNAKKTKDNDKERFVNSFISSVLKQAEQ